MNMAGRGFIQPRGTIFIMESAKRRPLYQLVAEIGSLWAAAMVGVFIVLPVFGVTSYNQSPVILSIYYLFWLAVAIFTFADLYRELMPIGRFVWGYGVVCAGFALLVWGILESFATLPMPSGFDIAPYTDLLLATPWYFLPKGVEIFVQQALITALVLALARQFRSVERVSLAYAILFGSVHAVLFFLSGAPDTYALVMTAGSILSAFLFPRIILTIPAGFVYTYMIHLTFYLTLASILHVWPPLSL